MPERHERSSDAERELLDALSQCPMTSGEIAYAFGIGLDVANARIADLHTRGLICRSGRLWRAAGAHAAD